jgi:hypothetical protein
MLPYILATMPPVAILQGGGGTIDIDIGLNRPGFAGGHLV